MSIIDWQTLKAPELPKWLVALTSKDYDRHFKARMKLADYLGQHAAAQSVGEYYYNRVLSTDAPVLITPIFIEMLKDETVVEPLSIAEFLEEMSGYWRKPGLGQIERQRAEKLLDIINQEFEFLVTMLEHPNPDVRTQIIGILCHLPMRRQDLGQLLLEHLKKFQAADDIETLTVIGVLHNIIKSKTHSTPALRRDYIHILNQWIEEATYPPVILSDAACKLMILEGKDVSKSVVDTLLNILMHMNFMIDFYIHRDWVDALLALGIDQGTHHMLTVLDVQKDEDTVFEISAVLLELHFGERDIESLYVHVLDKEETARTHYLVSRDKQLPHVVHHNLKDLQREILRHVVQKELLWRYRTNLFEVYHLPASRSDMEKLIEEA